MDPFEGAFTPDKSAEAEIFSVLLETSHRKVKSFSLPDNELPSSHVLFGDLRS